VDGEADWAAQKSVMRAGGGRDDGRQRLADKGFTTRDGVCGLKEQAEIGVGMLEQHD
jgi:hypothetical protein